MLALYATTSATGLTGARPTLALMPPPQGDTIAYHDTSVSRIVRLNIPRHVCAGSRHTLDFGFNNNYNVTNNYADLSDLEKVTSYTRNSTTAFQMLAGLEYRLQPGKRLQPIFGANLVYVHTNRWTYAESTTGSTDGDYTYTGAPTNKLGVMLNAGVEYFVTEQISLGANLDFAIAKTWRGTSVDNDPDPADANFSRINSKNTFIGTGNMGANITMNFYF